MVKVECKAKPGKRGVWLILADDEEWKEIHSSIFGSNPAIPPIFHSMGELEAWFLAADLQGTKRYALARLARKNQPSSEMRQALKKVMATPASIETVIAEFQASGYMDDKEWVRGFVKAKSNSKNGPLLISAKLRAKGITEQEIAEALTQNYSSNSEVDEIIRLIKKRYSGKELIDFHTRRKVVSSLMRKGFHPSAVMEALEKIGGGGDELEDYGH